MYCPFCGTDNPEDRKFCLACGTPLEEHAQKNLPKDKKDLHLKIVRQEEDLSLQDNQKDSKEEIQNKKEITDDQKSRKIELVDKGEKDSLENKKTSEKKLSKKHAIERKFEEGSQSEKIFTEDKPEKREVAISSAPEEGSKHKITREIKIENEIKEEKEEELEISNVPQRLYKNLDVSQPVKAIVNNETQDQAKVLEEREEHAPETVLKKVPEKKTEAPPLTQVAAVGELENKELQDQEKKDHVSQLTPEKKPEESPAKVIPNSKLDNKKLQDQDKKVEKALPESKETEMIPEKEEDWTSRSVLLGENNNFSTKDELSWFGLPKKKVKLLGIVAAAWIVLVVGFSLFYLSSNTNPDLSIPKTQEIVLNEVSDFKAKLKAGTMELVWIPSTNAVKIVDQILEIYNLDGNLVKQVNLGPSLFGYELSGLERGVEYRVVLRLKSDDGRLSGGKSIFVTVPMNHDTTRKQDLEELKHAIGTYFETKGYYPKSQNYASLLNTLVKEKLIKRRIQDPQYPEHEYLYKSMWDDESYELRIYLANSEDELFEGRAPKDQFFVYRPSTAQKAQNSLRAEE